MLSVWSRTRQGRFSASSPRIAARSSIRLLVVSGSPPDSSLSRAPERIRTAQPPGPGFPRQAPSVNISTCASSVTSGDELARKLEDHPLRAVVGNLFGHRESVGERVEHFTDENFRCRGAGGEADGPRL